MLDGDFFSFVVAARSVGCCYSNRRRLRKGFLFFLTPPNSESCILPLEVIWCNPTPVHVLYVAYCPLKPYRHHGDEVS